VTPQSSLALIERVGRDLTETDGCLSLCRARWQLEFRENVWEEMCSEYDARRLAGRVRDLDLPLSAAFGRFRDAWLLDEHRHYLGFRRLYSILYDTLESDLAVRVEARGGDLSALTAFLVDEFSLLVLLAYDEIITAKAYARDFAIYDALADPHLSTWIRHVCRDESIHCRGAIEILKRLHASRLGEVPSLLDVLTGISTQGTEYEGSFVLDHQHYPRELIEGGRRAVLTFCSASGRASSPV
jgi:hypothetical protein